MFLQIIPYVADQFDPGAWVFDGENLKKSSLIGNATPDFSVYTFEESFDFSKNSLLESNTVLGVYLLESQQFSKSEMFGYSIVVALTGMDFDAGVEADSISNSYTYLLASDYSAGVEVESINDINFSQPVDGEIQNSIGQPDTRPWILTFNAEVTPIDLDFADMDFETQFFIHQAPVELEATNPVNVSSEVKYVSNKPISTVGDATGAAFKKNVGFMVVKSTELTMSTLSGKLIMGTQWNPQPSNTPTITM